MAKTFDYEKHAQECELKAATAPNDTAREVWRDLGAFWRKRLKAAEPSLMPKQDPKGESTR